MSIKNLAPKAVWKHFYSLTQIPRPSKKEARIIEFMKNFAKENQLECVEDQVGNIIIKKPATPGMENRKGVVLQGHLDMVPQKNNDVEHDFEKDPIEAYVDGQWVTAKGTTLGADNGIGVAAAMAVLEAKDLKHGPVEALFTIDEETGMTGAFGLKPGLLSGDILINMDSEDEGELYVGCAGGMEANIRFEYTNAPLPPGMIGYKITVGGLKGGHSGIDIILGRANANKLLTRYLLHATQKHGVRLASIDGGGLRNAIPREATAIVAVPEPNRKDFEECVKKYEETYINEFKGVEPGLKFSIAPADLPQNLIDENTHTQMVKAVFACPNDVIRMSDSMPGLVETSSNLASVKSENGKIAVQCLMRSSVDSAKIALSERIASVFELAGAASVEFAGQYPGWKPNMESPILKHTQNVYNGLYGKIPEIKAIHAGLECGILGAAYPNWDMISFGPTIRFPHSPDEKVNIETVEKFWNLLVETLKQIPEK